MHIDSSNRFHRNPDKTDSCPHCHTRSQITLVASPDFRSLRTTRPALTGTVFQCGACGTPFLQQYRITRNNPDSIELEVMATVAEHTDDRFSYSYLPASIATCFRDAAGCYQHGLLQAFAAMCRLTLQAIVAEQGDHGRMRIANQVDEIAALAQLSAADVQLLRDVLFDNQSQTLVRASAMDKGMAAVLLEILKDILQQQYVRPARLRKALRMRRFFAAAEDTAETSRIAALRTPRATGTD